MSSVGDDFSSGGPRIRVGWRMARVAAAIAMCAGIAVAGCNAVLGIGDPIVLPTALEAGSGVGFWSGPGDRGCISAKTPTKDQRPSPQSPKDIAPIYLAMQSIRLGAVTADGQVQNNAWEEIGFDLDGICTGVDTCGGTDSPRSCKPTVPQISIDGHDCRDNTFGRFAYTATLVPELSKKYGLSDDALNCALCVGDYNYLFKISNYNGEANDDSVRVDFYPSPGLKKPLPWDCTDPSWKDHPCFTPDQQFQVIPDSMDAPRPGPDLADAKVFDAAAFVRDGYLVVNFPDDTLVWFPGYKALVVAYPIRMQKGVVAGKLTLDSDGVWRITDGTIGGRVTGADLLLGFRQLGLCEADTSTYSVMVDFVNKNLDVLADGRNDSEATCDAMSAGIAFKAQQILAGSLASVEPLGECVLRGTASADAGAKDGN
jgi:hypothetical protein